MQIYSEMLYIIPEYCLTTLSYSHLPSLLCRFIYVSNLGAREIVVYEKNRDGSLKYIQVSQLIAFVCQTCQ